MQRKTIQLGVILNKSHVPPPSTHVRRMPMHMQAQSPRGGREDGLAGDHEEQVNSSGRRGRWKSQKKPAAVFESSGIPLLLRGSSGRRQEPVERARGHRRTTFNSR
ncbi:Hypothetical protein SMAX5B_018343 [Scophthalmus maximus]|uniref:Uncharacterized protein n=1 Tax=Scophthalmus maximus TaxID=52904 RepID=A0A2U9CB66_SCOMX|nr:Hypothetical protein SMAX5B_018343 [Scophthalmus maximus]